MGDLATPPVTVVVYHGVGDCPPAADPYRLLMPVAHFRDQMAFLARHRAVVPLAEAVAGGRRRDRPVVAITFDDGYRSVLSEALPVLQRLGLPASVFVPTGWLGDRNRWDAFGPDHRPLPLMDAGDLRRLDGAGIEVASHGHRHADLRHLAPETARRDLEESVATLTAVLGRPPRFLAYPYGSHSAAVREAAAAAGFEAAFSIGQRHAGRFALERVSVRPFDGPRLFAAKTSGRYLRWRLVRVERAAYRVARSLPGRAPNAAGRG